MESPKILIIDDEDNFREGMIELLETHHYQTTGAANAEEALKILEEQVFDLIITDYKMQQMDGMHFLKTISGEYPSIKVIMITGYSSVEHAVEAMKSGAINYIEKPPQPKKLLEIIEKSLSSATVKKSDPHSRKELQKLFHFHQMVGLSKPMQEVYRKIQEVAPTDVPVLILGESGTGKELVSRAIHDYSSRKEFPFVAVNTGGIPRELIASELFGHLRGSFTGAISDKKGKFEEANLGSLFLDEIGTMSTPVQISLLRVLENQEIERIGSGKPIRVDVRIICASNENLLHLIDENRFREDLYYRLNVFAIELPPLRKRKPDIPYLLDYYQLLFNNELSKNIKGFTTESQEAIKNYSWPGNIRELRNVVLRAMLSANDTIELKHLPQNLIGNKVGSEIISFKAGTPLSVVEQTMIIETLKAVQGNKLKASEILGISRRSLYNKLEEYDINDKDL